MEHRRALRRRRHIWFRARTCWPFIAQNQGGVAGAIARLHVQTADKKDHFIVTDEQAKITQDRRQGLAQVPISTIPAWFAAIVLGDASIGPWNLEANAVAQFGDKKGVKSYNTTAVDPKVKTR